METAPSTSEPSQVLKYLLAIFFPPAIPTYLLLEENKLEQDNIYLWFGIIGTIMLIILTSLCWIPGIIMAFILIFQYKNYKPRK